VCLINLKLIFLFVIYSLGDKSLDISSNWL